MNKKNIRKAFKQIEKLSNQMNEGAYMDRVMDGSGECSGMINRSWGRWFNTEVKKTLIENHITLDELKTIALEWGERELEMGPKHITLDWGYNGSSFQKEKDILDTKWGSLAFELTMVEQAY